LPILGFFFGFAFGAQTVQAIFGDGFLTTITSWISGFFFAVVFAVMSYLFYFLAVTIVAGALGYFVGAGLMQAIGFDFGFLVWLVGVIVGVVVSIGALYFNVQKWVVILATSVLGAGTIVGTFLAMFGGLPSAQVVQQPVRTALASSPFWMITFIIIAAIGAVVQFETTRRWEVDSYERMSGMTGPDEASAGSAMGQTGVSPAS